MNPFLDFIAKAPTLWGKKEMTKQGGDLVLVLVLVLGHHEWGSSRGQGFLKHTFCKLINAFVKSLAVLSSL